MRETINSIRTLLQLLPRILEMAEDSARLDWLSKQGVAKFDRGYDYAYWHKDWHVTCDNDTGRRAMETGRDYLRVAIDAARGKNL